MKEFCSHEGITVAEKLRSRPLLCNARSYQQGRLVSIILGSGGSRPSDKGGGGGHPDPEIRAGGAASKHFFFQAFGPHFGLKIRGESGPPRPLPWIRHCSETEYKCQLQSVQLSYEVRLLKGALSR